MNAKLIAAAALTALGSMTAGAAHASRWDGCGRGAELVQWYGKYSGQVRSACVARVAPSYARVAPIIVFPTIPQIVIPLLPQRGHGFGHGDGGHRRHGQR